MVTKPSFRLPCACPCSVLAKIHMVTKHGTPHFTPYIGSVLAKIHMVTKLAVKGCPTAFRSVLAKIHMVTKPQKYGSTFLNVIEY